MKYDPIPVTPEVIRWARARAGFSLQEAGKKFKNIEDWESGIASPTYPQLERLAETFKVPVAVFFFPEPPVLPPISETFRTLPMQEFEQIPPHIRQLLRKAKSFQINLNELTGGKNPAVRQITHDLSLTTSEPVATMAQRVRSYLDTSVEGQTAWPSDEEALDNWRQILLDVGISVFKDAFRDSGYSGFCLYDEEFPIIYVNNSSAKTRQIFTLFHELAHLLFQTSGIDTPSDSFVERLPDHERIIEIICNRFAAEFLLPDDVFREAFAGKEPSESTAEELASRFHVSREFIYRKFRDRNLIDDATYSEAAQRWADQLTSGTGGNYYYTRITYLGENYINLAFSQYYQNRINDVQLAEYLDIKPRHLSTLEEYVARGAA
jgi:Zn-dependent peptidase ImmA (M78 family)/transcriptional regulator with XRE-family HTH domain